MPPVGDHHQTNTSTLVTAIYIDMVMMIAMIMMIMISMMCLILMMTPIITDDVMIHSLQSKCSYDFTSRSDCTTSRASTSALA